MSRNQRIEQLINHDLDPSFLEVINESNRHHVPEGSETHFKLTIISDAFQNKPRIDRHRLVNKLLAQEFENGLHALSLHLYTAEEWQGKTPNSPACRDGYRHG